METKFLLFTILMLLTVKRTIAQNADEDAIKQTLKMETEAAIKGDTAAWKTFFVQDENTTTISYTGNGYNNNFIGWQNISAQLIPFIKNNPGSEKYRFTDADVIINESNNLAAIQYNQVFFDDKDSPFVSREYRTLVKVDNDWKIVSLMAIGTNSYTSADSGTIENIMNGAGYQLLSAKKYNDAIDVFKLNVKLFPKSWNVYDSLGEAYADNGDKKNAIENYEQSLQLNPKNDNGKDWLKKLKK